ncbi:MULTISPECIES: MFS transporter [unclassified Curtobacterium]|uniref:MFS transporter n=1 Tax=unclassified Curtobacterium TaxID=257496 RepID=UPI000D83105B|nr:MULTISPECIES: MFS transporter [unclassified Curtobacterium]PYY38488.1 MFS transporter [Curtobacterium sp. MCBD17_030]PZE39555.1 MFS transporter [Curtobacterium sp. MCPF17_031]PZF14659.1 MFS transporter [Curtobacterium sp. MCPF17_011]
MTTAPAAAPAKGTPFRGRIRGRVLLLLCCMYAISYIDRTNISTALPHITDEFGLTETAAGFIVSAFSLPYALLQVFGGTISEKFGPRRALFVITVVWGVATLWTGLSLGFWTLFAARLLLGLSEAAAFPSATQAMSRWIPRDRNGFAQGVVHSAARLGNALAPLLVAYFIAISGWRLAFFATAVLSVAWGIAWFFLFRDRPEDAHGITKAELAELPPVETRATRPPVPWRALAKQILPVSFVDFGYGWTLWVFLTWIPTFLSDQYDLEINAFAWFTTAVLLAGVVGDTVGGMLSDRIIHRGGDSRQARRLVLVIGLCGSLVCLLPLVVVGQSLTVATVSLALSFFFLELCNANLWAIPMDVAPQWSGTASGFMNTGFGVAGVVSPIVFGFLIDTSGWQLPFGISCALLAGAAVVAWVMKPQRLTVTDGVLEVGVPAVERDATH